MKQQISASLPFVSIIIPNYSGRDFLPECLSSALSQDYPSFELILVDDCSSDDSVEIASQIFSQIPNAETVRNERNLGRAVSCNRGVNEARET